ncbi:MAG TPA: DUF5681 domain-containing protein [Sphingomonadaceae bacterium]|nr:DUF5681 domain-containing protein [Sphingomonadaceae bacterium]
MTKRVGYCSPPVEHRFKKGICPNPKGRPKGSRNMPKKARPHPFYEKVTGLVGGKQKRITRIKALLLYARDLVAKNPGEHRLADYLMSLEKRMTIARQRVWAKPIRGLGFVVEDTDPRMTTVCSLEAALEQMDAVTVHYAYQPYAKAMFEPWLVEAALARLGERRLTREEQRKVIRHTARASSVNWPSWWEPDLRGRKRRETVRPAPAFEGELP